MQTIEALSARLAFGEEVDLGGRDIRLSGSAPATRSVPLPVSRTEQLPGGWSCIGWVLQDAPGAACWDLAQHGAVLCNVTLRIPEHGRLHVLGGESPGTWRNVTIAGASTCSVCGWDIICACK